MKYTVQIFIPADVGSPGSRHSYTFTDDAPDHGTIVAGIITGAVDERPDSAGRLAELRRALSAAAKRKPRPPQLKPDGARVVGGWHQYHPISRMTGYSVRVAVRMHRPEDDHPNADGE